MAHGQPDYGFFPQKSTIYGLQDMAELAARLGSISVYDRRGDVMFADDFSHGLAAYDIGARGSGAGYAISTLYSKSGSFSLKLTPGTDGFGDATLNKYLPYTPVSNIGFEVSFTTNEYVDNILINLHMRSSSDTVTATIKFDDVNSKLQYKDSNGDYQDIATSFTLMEQDYIFHTAKLVADYDNEKYVRLLLNDQEYDLSSYNLYKTGSGGDPHMQAYFDVNALSGMTGAVYVDNLIITQNEP